VNPNQRTIRIGNWPRSPVNPYLDLYYNALGLHGIQRVCELSINDSCLRSKLGDLDAIHLHWTVESIWYDSDPIRALRKLFGFYRYLRLANRNRKKIIWTIHEPLSGERDRWINRLGYGLLGNMSDLCICHDDSTLQSLAASQKRIAKKTIVMRHGNFESVFPPPRAGEQVRKEYGLDPNLPTLLGLGFVTHHKGFDLAVEAVKQLGGRFQLIIAGQPDPSVRQELSSSVAGCGYIKLLFRSLSQQEVADLHEVSQAVLLPYRRVTASASLLTALSLRRGVIASSLPYFVNTAKTHPLAALFFEKGNSLALKQAIEEFFSVDPQLRFSAAQSISAEHRWEDCILPVAKWFREQKWI
jgi:beta-1,4-mannosyltransferase